MNISQRIKYKGRGKDGTIIYVFEYEYINLKEIFKQNLNKMYILFKPSQAITKRVIFIYV